MHQIYEFCKEIILFHGNIWQIMAIKKELQCTYLAVLQNVILQHNNMAILFQKTYRVRDAV